MFCAFIVTEKNRYSESTKGFNHLYPKLLTNYSTVTLR